VRRIDDCAAIPLWKSYIEFNNAIFIAYGRLDQSMLIRVQIIV